MDVLAIFRQRSLSDESVTKALVVFVRERFPAASLDRILYYYAALADWLLHDVVIEVLVPLQAKGITDIDVVELQGPLKRWVDEGKTSGEWSEATIVRIAQGLLSALRDFGVLQGAVKKRIAPAYLPIEAFAFLMFFLKRHQPSGAKLVELPDWKLFFLPREGVEEIIQVDLTETGAIFSETKEKVRKLREALNEEALGVLRQARMATEQVWHRLAAHGPAAEVSQCVVEVKGLLASEQVAQTLDTIAAKTKTVLDAYKQAYQTLFDRRAETYQKAVEEIKNRPEGGPLEQNNKDLARSLLSPLVARVGSEADRAAVANGTGLGQASLTEMESDLAAVEGLKSSVLVKLQEMSMGGEKKAPIRRVKVSEFFNRPIQTQQDLEAALTQLRDSLQKYIDEGAAIILE